MWPVGTTTTVKKTFVVIGLQYDDAMLSPVPIETHLEDFVVCLPSDLCGRPLCQITKTLIEQKIRAELVSLVFQDVTYVRLDFEWPTP